MEIVSIEVELCLDAPSPRSGAPARPTDQHCVSRAAVPGARTPRSRGGHVSQRELLDALLASRLATSRRHAAPLAPDPTASCCASFPLSRALFHRTPPSRCRCLRIEACALPSPIKRSHTHPVCVLAGAAARIVASVVNRALHSIPQPLNYRSTLPRTRSSSSTRALTSSATPFKAL